MYVDYNSKAWNEYLEELELHGSLNRAGRINIKNKMDAEANVIKFPVIETFTDNKFGFRP